MIEYLFDAIRATTGQDIHIAAEITDDNGIVLTEGCYINLFSPDKEYIASFDGEYNEENGEWIFTIPAEATEGLVGRYFYCIAYNGQSLCFRAPLYLV
jgi:hypothetical protein